MAREFAAPATNSGDMLDIKDLVGQLVAVIGHEYVTGIDTEYGTTDAIRLDVVVLTQQNEHDRSYGVRYTDVLWFSVPVRNALKKQLGKLVLARIGTQQFGKNTGFVLEDATQDGDAVRFAEAWLDQHPDFETDAQAKAAGGARIQAPAADAAPVPAAPAVPPVPQASSVPAVPAAAAPAVPAVPTSAPPAAAPVNPQAQLANLANMTPEQQQALLTQLLQGSGN